MWLGRTRLAWAALGLFVAWRAVAVADVILIDNVDPEVAFTGTVDPTSVATLDAVADAHVKGQNDANVNYGANPQLRIKRNYDSTWNRKAYMRFNLSGLAFDRTTSLADATLRLNFVDSGAGGTGNDTSWLFEVYGLADGDPGEGWLESEITWNNAPANDTDSGHELLANALSLGTFSLTGKGIGEFGFSSEELIDFIAESTVDDLLTFIIVRDTAGTGTETYSHAIGSWEQDAVLGPQLFLVSSEQVIPEPTTLALVALGLLGCARRRRRPARPPAPPRRAI